MLSLKVRNLKGLDNEIFEQQLGGYFPVVSIQKQLPKVFYNSVLKNFEKIHDKTHARDLFC